MFAAQRRVAEQVARQAGTLLKRHFRRLRSSEIHRKSPTELVTNFDREAERLVTRRLTRAFPADGLVAEEGTARLTRSGYTWYVDPLDGTGNYVQGRPGYAVSVALVVNGAVMLGVVYEPEADTLFSTVIGQGAKRNRRRLAVSAKRSLAQAVVSVSAGYGQRTRPTGKTLVYQIERRVRALRSSGAVALDLVAVASGKAEAALKAGPVHPWDVLAGLLLVREAGGTISDLRGEPFSLWSTDLLASNRHLHHDLLAVVLGSSRRSSRRARLNR